MNGSSLPRLTSPYQPTGSMRLPLLALLLLCGACKAAPHAQPASPGIAAILSGRAAPFSPGDTAFVAGTIRDASTRAPVPGVIVRRDGPHGFGARSDSAGAYRLGELPVGAVHVRLYCPTRTFGLGQPVPGQTLQVRAGRTGLDLLVPLGLCTEPPPDSLRAEFRGHYRGGFELSSFVPCGVGGVPDPAFARRIEGQTIWVRINQKAMEAHRERKPADTTRAPRVFRQGEEPAFYVRWTGVLVGPGMYGHFGVSPYLLRVESIAKFEESSPPDCPAPPRHAR